MKRPKQQSTTTKAGSRKQYAGLEDGIHMTDNIFQIKEDMLRRMYLSKVWEADNISTDQEFYVRNLHTQTEYVREKYLDECLAPRLKTTLVRFRLRSH